MSESRWKNRRLGIVGCGNMAEALVRGVLSAGLMPASGIVAYDPLPGRRGLFAGLGCAVVDAPLGVLSADAILLAVKPQVIKEAVGPVAAGARPETLFISIAAGVPARSIENLLFAGAKVVRVMPNTPLLVGKGVSALAGGANAGPEDTRLVRDLFACGGEAVEVREDMLDAVTTLSGSGPAYFFRFVEALIGGGTALGLSPELAKSLAIGTIAGAAALLGESGDPASLRERVTSPGGTTAAALAVFERRNLVGIVAEAMAAANGRSAELGRDS